MATLRHVTPSSVLGKFQADGFLFDWVCTKAKCLFFNQKVHHHVQTNSPLDIVVSRQNPVLTFTAYLFLEFSLLYIRLDIPRMFLKWYPLNRYSASNTACSCHYFCFVLRAQSLLLALTRRHQQHVTKRASRKVHSSLLLTIWEICKLFLCLTRQSFVRCNICMTNCKVVRSLWLWKLAFFWQINTDEVSNLEDGV